MPTKNNKHNWEFTKYFRANVYGWKGTALASKRIKDAVKEIKSVAQKEPVTAAEGAVLFIEKCWRAIEHIDSSSGAIGTAVNNALIEMVQIIHDAPLAIQERQKLTERIWESWQEEGYGYYDELSKRWVEICVKPEILIYWADNFLPIVKNVFSSDTPGSYFKGSEPCLSCLFETGRYDELIEIIQSDPKPMFHYRKYFIKVIAARGDIEKALSMIDESLYDSYSSIEAANLGEDILLNAGRTEEAYKRYGLMMPFQSTGLATLSAIRKKYPEISPQRILNDLLDADRGNEGRYFAAARKIGMIELAIEIAEKHNVEPKTLITACKDYFEKDPGISVKFGLIALQRYADGYGYEPEYSDVKKCYDFLIKASEKTGQVENISAMVKIMAVNDKSIRKLVSLVVNR
jgi:hypothetical protein